MSSKNDFKLLTQHSRHLDQCTAAVHSSPSPDRVKAIRLEYIAAQMYELANQMEALEHRILSARRKWRRK
jgi:hypothetical protein